MWKCKPFGWLWGLPLLALLWLLVIFGERRNIEADLSERVTTSLEDAGLDWAQADFEGRDGVLRGTAGSIREQDNAIALAEKTWGVRIVDEDMDILRTASPYTWSASKEGKELILEGFAPNRDDRQAILTMARSQFPGFRIVDNMQIATGAPDRRSYMDTVVFGLKQLAGFKFGKVGLRDTRFSIEGLTNDKDTFGAFKDAMRDELPANMRVVTNRVKAPETIIPLVSPFRWTATKTADTIRLGGYTHTKNDRSDIVAAAKRAFPDHRIMDNMQYAKGRPTNLHWRRGTTFALSQLMKLEQGMVGLSDFNYSIRGNVADTQNYADLEAERKKIPRGFELTSKSITLPKIDPYVWRADYHAERVTLSGHVPDDDVKRKIKAQAKRHFPSAYIVDQTEIGFGAPDRWERVTDLSLSQLARLESGNTMIWNTEIEMRGKAASEERRGNVRAQMNSSVPDAYSFYDEIRVPEAVKQDTTIYVTPPDVTEFRDDQFDANEPLERSVCQSYLDSILAANSIMFATASAELSPASFATMTRLAHTANRCPKTRIEIAGHTDSDGGSKFNEFLSLRRARSVVKFLLQNGVSEDRLSAVGYGEARPVLPNTSKDNKAKNRRIEFVVKDF